MIDESTTNSQVTDSVTQSNTTVIGQAPASTQGLLDAVMAETIGMSMHNAVTAQQNSQMMGSAAVAATCARLLKAPVVLDPAPAPSSDPTLDQVLVALVAACVANETLSESSGIEVPSLAGFKQAITGNQDLLDKAKTDLEGIEKIDKAAGGIVKLLATEVENQRSLLAEAQKTIDEVVDDPTPEQIGYLDILGNRLKASSGNIGSISELLAK